MQDVERASSISVQQRTVPRAGLNKPVETVHDCAEGFAKYLSPHPTAKLRKAAKGEHLGRKTSSWTLLATSPIPTDYEIGKRLASLRFTTNLS